MEHVSATLAFDPPDEAGLDVGTGGLWSDNDLDSWRSDVEQLNVFAAARHHRPRSLTVAQEEV